MPAYLGVTLTHSLGYSSFYVFLSAFSLLGTDLFYLSPPAIGTWLSVTMLGLVAGLFTARLVVQRLGMTLCISIGVTLVVSGSLTFLALSVLEIRALMPVMASQLLLMFGGGLVAPNTTALSMMLLPERAGLAAAGLGFLSMALVAFAVWLVGVTYNETLLSIAVLQLAFAGLSAACWIALGRRSQARTSPTTITPTERTKT